MVNFDIFGVDAVWRNFGVGDDTKGGRHVAGDDVAGRRVVEGNVFVCRDRVN